MALTSGKVCELLRLAMALLIGTAIGHAQQVFGNIYGTVTDQSGGGVPNGKVTITDQDRGSKFEARH